MNSRQESKKIRLLLGNHNTLISAGMRCLLEKIFSIEVVGEVNLGQKLIDQSKAFRPDVHFLFLETTGVTGLESASLLLKHVPSARILIMVMNTSKEFVMQALQAGIKGVLPHRSPRSELEKSIHSVAAGQIYLSPSMPRQVLNESKRYLFEGKLPFEELTSRQKTILKFLAQGKNTKEIAHRLKVSSKTVEFHRARLMARLKIRDVPGLVRYALRIGLIPLEG